MVPLQGCLHCAATNLGADPVLAEGNRYSVGDCCCMVRIGVVLQHRPTLSAWLVQGNLSKTENQPVTRSNPGSAHSLQISQLQIADGSIAMRCDLCRVVVCVCVKSLELLQLREYWATPLQRLRCVNQL